MLPGAMLLRGWIAAAWISHAWSSLGRQLLSGSSLKVMSSIYALETLAELDATKPLLDFVVEGGDAFVKEMVVYPLRSIWGNKQQWSVR